MQPRLPAGLTPGGRFAQWTRRPPRFVVADVDGTLIADGRTARPTVVTAAGAAAAAGLRVGVATGRLPAGVIDLLDQLNLPGPHIVQNGAQVIEHGTVLHTWQIDPATAAQLARWCMARDLYAEFFVGEQFLVTDRRDSARKGWELISGEPHGLLSDVDWNSTTLVKATVVVAQSDDLPDLLVSLRELGLIADPSTSPMFPGEHFVNVTSPDADKGRAVTWAAEHIGIALDDVAAIGDGDNDLSMLAVAGTAIAMGQAPDAVRDIAHVIVPEVGDDGVAHALDAAVAGWGVA